MLDYLVGLDTEVDELVEGGSCYTPTVTMDQVVLPEETKQMILDSVRHYDAFCAIREKVGLDDVVSYGKG